MTNTSSSISQPDEVRTADGFFVIYELLETPPLARFYTDLLIHSPTTVTAVRDRLELPKGTAKKYAHTLAELGVAEDLETIKNGSSLWRTDPLFGTWMNETELELGPTIIAVYGATSVNDDLELFLDRHGKAALVSAVKGTLDYLTGETTRRGVADYLDVPAVEAIAVTQVIEQIIAVVKDHDPTISVTSFDVDIYDRAAKQVPY